jgi:hypothetical protein
VVKSLQADADELFPWPDLQSRWCMRLMAVNFYKKFSSKKLMDMFYQNQEGKFNALWKDLDDLTRAYFV